MYSLTIFRKLPNGEQWAYFWDKAVYICEHQDSHGYYMLYSLDEFFVEIMFDRIWGKAKKIFAFEKGYHLDKYLKTINLKLEH